MPARSWTPAGRPARPARPRAPPPAAGTASCPASYAAPDPGRPRIALTFDLAEDLATVRGTEKVTFTPDLPVTEVVFRLTANTAPSVAEGNGIQVTSATATPAGGAFRVEPAGAAGSTQGGVLVVPLGREVPAGQQVTAEVGFTLTLGRQAFDRFGRLQQYAWWGSGQPLLAWERGVGWHREPMLQFTAESATSEAAAVDLTVTAPAAYTRAQQWHPGPAGGGRQRPPALARGGRPGPGRQRRGRPVHAGRAVGGGHQGGGRHARRAPRRPRCWPRPSGPCGSCPAGSARRPTR